ncbi:hypothetical protein M378DRAFT_533207 [Amanita muscaria Koide BX008]|uniref:Uncharacterized protein n=1 Tax=Amanita muscaria (strain Koide BX008) TaxID=946122 RepID=A0A0C2W509_AMAMK|nr:hypothetical protein M378DRAFT_533207 [Amanita muscaria Koide BX008]
MRSSMHFVDLPQSGMTWRGKSHCGMPSPCHLYHSIPWRTARFQPYLPDCPPFSV